MFVVRPLRLALAAALLTLAPRSAPHAQPTTADGDSLLLEGIGVNPKNGRFYGFRVTPDGTVRIDDLASSEPPTSPLGGLPPPPDSVVASIELPVSTLAMISDEISKIYNEEPVSRSVGFSFDDDQFRLMFEQGVPVWMAAISSLAFVVFGVGSVLWIARRRERARALEEAAARQRALFAREAERSRLAREIHDGPLQDIHALRLLPGDEVVALVGGEAGRIAKELRAIAEGLRPPALGRFGLAAALSAHASRVKERHPDLVIHLALDEDDPDSLPDIVRSALFRIAQESITNAIEHGQASTVRITLRLDTPDSAVSLDVSDNGKGLGWPSPPDLAALADAGHFGMVGMYERAEAIGGTLTLDDGGIDDGGARVAVRVPSSSLARLSYPRLNDHVPPPRHPRRSHR